MSLNHFTTRAVHPMAPEGQGSGPAGPGVGEKMPTTVTPMTEADLNELRGEFRESMMGDHFVHMDANRYDTEGRGMYSGQPALNPEPPIPQPEQAVYAEPEPPAPPQPAQNWQQLYGQSENEKGGWRDLAQRQSEQLLALQQQITAISAGPGMGYQPAPVGPPPRLFPERPPGELLTWGEAEGLILNEILPTLDLKMRQAQDIATARAQRMFEAWDVSPQEEQAVVGSLRMQFPGFDGRFTETEKNVMIQREAQAARAMRPPAGSVAYPSPPMATAVGRVNGSPQHPVSAPPMYVDPNRVVRRQTYIESAPPAQMASEPTSSLSPAQAFQADLTAFERQAGRKAKATEYRDLLIKHGVGIGQDFGPDVSVR